MLLQILYTSNVFAFLPWIKYVFSNGSFTEASFSGGGNITFKGSLEGDAYYTARLFLGELTFGDLPVHFTYSVSHYH